MTTESQENESPEINGSDNQPLGGEELFDGQLLQRPSAADPRPYVRDDLFKQLLSHYQNAELDESLSIVAKLIKLYPDETSLTDFQDDIRMRLMLYEKGSESQKAETRLKIGQFSGWLIFGGVALIALIFLGRWGITQFQINQEARLQEIQATSAVQTLITKYENAEDYLAVGRPAQALQLYMEIEELYPGYRDIEAKMIVAQKYVELEELYQEGFALYEQGDMEEAYQILTAVYEQDASFKDIAQLLTRVDNQRTINQLVENIHTAFNDSDWQTLIDNYNQILEINPAFSLPEIEEELFIGYMNMIILIADRSDATMEDITQAESYYRSALALFPQAREFAEEREELERIATNLIVNKLYIYAISLIETENYSIRSMEEAVKIFSRADQINPGSPAVSTERTLAQTFLNSYTAFSQQNFDDAITGFENLLRLEPDYAGGIIRYFLYESHVARGDIFTTAGDFASAREDFENAEIYAWSEGGSKLQLFQVEVRLGYILRRLSLYEESSAYYHFAATLIGVQDYIDPSQTEVLDSLREAQVAYLRGLDWEVSRLYDYVYQEANYIFPTTTVRVFRGDSLAHLSFSFGSTLDAIREQNNLGDAMEARLDQEILIPYLEDKD